MFWKDEGCEIKIQIEVIPTKCTGRNLHSHDLISQDRWMDISQRIRARRKCQYCGNIFNPENLNAHEVWEFDAEKRIQRLKEIVCACRKCHNTIHYNFLLSNQKLRDRDAFICKAHYMEVNNCGEWEFESELNTALQTYRILNQIEGNWSLDITYAIRAGFLVYDDINLENLELLAAGSKGFLLPYQSAQVSGKLYFNHIPKECLIDEADSYCKKEKSETCEICGRQNRTLYRFYGLRVRNNSAELMLAGTKRICGLCRKTIFYGAHRTFMKFRKTTRHYMEINNCSYQECVQHARNARRFIKANRAMQLYIYLKTPDLPQEKLLMRNRYIIERGASFDRDTKRWYLRPVRNLKDFVSWL